MLDKFSISLIFLLFCQLFSIVEVWIVSLCPLEKFSYGISFLLFTWFNSSSFIVSEILEISSISFDEVNNLVIILYNFNSLV